MIDAKNVTETAKQDKVVNKKVRKPFGAKSRAPRKNLPAREDIFVDYINGTPAEITESLSRKVGNKGYNARVRDLLVSVAIAMTWARDNSGAHVGPRVLASLMDMDTLHAILNRQHKDFVRIPDEVIVGIRHYLSGLSGYDPVQGASQSGLTISNHTFQERKALDVLRGNAQKKTPKKKFSGKPNDKKEKEAVPTTPSIEKTQVVDKVNGFVVKKKTVTSGSKVVSTSYQVIISDSNLKDFAYLKEAREFAKEYKEEVA
jgi:hypothetical protein